ncbi:phage integrase N-terminal SAM-like domain-containing protein [bacterium]|nr:phage integrase N-terminal SAM-like domain-containing protein [bacterium]
MAERVRTAVHSAGARRGLARRTKQCYGAWAARYAVFAGGEREVMRVETASRFLTSVVVDEDCAYSTQKQALNALVFFFQAGVRGGGTGVPGETARLRCAMPGQAPVSNASELIYVVEHGGGGSFTFGR